MPNEIIRQEFAGEIRTTAGAVPGRFYNVIANTTTGRILNQKFKAGRTTDRERVEIEMRFDSLGHDQAERFALTASAWEKAPNGRWVESWAGCAHDEIVERFPALAPLVRWHLCGVDGPMHYAANAVYFAGDRDPRGKRAGEPYAWDDAVRFGEVPVRHRLKPAFAKFLREAAPHPGARRFDFEVIRIDHDERDHTGKRRFSPKYTFGGFGTKWHECPFDSEDEALRFLAALQDHAPTFEQVPTLFSEGKARDLDAARRAAVWPDATDEELTAEPDVLRAALEARLPALVAEFRADMERAGFLWPQKVDASAE